MSSSSAPQRRPLPWAPILVALIVLVLGWIFLRDNATRDHAEASAKPRGPILGLDDDATKRQNRELFATVPAGAESSRAQPSASAAAPSASASARPSASPSSNASASPSSIPR
ncbi:MAG: hypothetical protein U0271_32070 [Polyangiaceae bacterium]